MNREQANKAVADKIGISGPFTDNLVLALEALGLLKLEEPKGLIVMVPVVSIFDRDRPHDRVLGQNLAAMVREDTLIETLREVGYEVYKR